MQSSTAMAVHMPVRPKRGTSSSALPTRTIQMLPKFRRLGTSVSPAPRSAPAATIDAPNKGSARSSMRSTLAARVCTSGTGVRRPKTTGQMSIMTEKRAEADADIAAALGLFHVPRADRAADERSSRVRDAVARHVADAFGRDGKSVCRDRYRAEGRNDGR